MSTPYVKQTWIDGVAGGTPISAARLTHIEDGVESIDLQPSTAEQDLQGKPTFAFHLVKGYPEHDPYSYDRTIGQGDAAVDTAAVQAALTACGTRGRLKLNPLSLNLNTGLVIPPGVFWDQDPECTITAQHAGVALTFDGGGSPLHTGQDGKQVHVRIRRPGSVAPWATTPESSVGVRFLNTYHYKVTNDEIFGFDTAMEFVGDGAGNTQNIVNLGYLVNNRRGLVIRLANGGFVNSSTFIGGGIHMDSNAQYQNQAGSRFILVPENANCHTFLNIDVEANGAGPVEKAIECAGTQNYFIGLRYELLVAGQVHFTAASSFNWVIAGFGNFGPGRAPFLDDGLRNMISGMAGMKRFADATGAAYEGQATQSNSNRVFRALNTAGQETAALNGSGTLSTRNGTQSFDRVRVNPVSTLPGNSGIGGIEVGLGTADPDVGIGRTLTAAKGIQANAPIMRKTTAVTVTVNGAQAITPGDGDTWVYTLQANITSMTIGSTPAVTGWSQEIRLVFVQDATGGRTYAFPTSFRFAGGSAPAPSSAANVKDSFQFRWNGTTWDEVSRSLNIAA